MSPGGRDMLMNLKRYLKRYSRVILGCSFLAGVWSCVLDWDHVWFVLGLPDPWNFSGFEGRPFHTVGWFLLWSVIASLMARHLESRIMDWLQFDSRSNK